MVKKAVSIVLALSILVGIITTNMASAASVKGDDVVRYAKEWLGTPYSKADCSYFVCKVYEKCGVDLWKYRTSLTTDTVKAGIAKKVGSSMEDLFSIGQVGDLVHFPGHIAIYIGNKQVIHSTSSKGVTISTLSNTGYWGGTGKKVDRIARLNVMSDSSSNKVVDMSDVQKDDKKQQNVAEPSSLTIDITQYPTTITQGDSFNLKGSIKSNYNVTSVVGTIVNSNGENKGTTMEAPGAKSNDVQSLHLGKSLSFNKLMVGSYTLKIEVMDLSGNIKIWSREFKVKKKEEIVQKEPESTLSINLTNCPSSIENGESVLLMGTIASNYLIKEAKVVIFAPNGIGHYPTTIYPNSKSVRIENTDLSNGIYFEGLPGGTYRIVITAKDEKTTKEITKSIKISERKIEEDDDLYSADIDIEINNNKNFENTKKQKCGNNAYWDFDNGVLTISGSGKMNDYSSPWELPWYDIQSDVRKIVIEEGITYIGNNAFCWHGANSNNSVNINEIYIPSTVEGLGNCTFAYVDGVDTVYYNARDCEFAGTSLTFAYNYFARGTKLVIGEDVERIGENVFYRGQFDEVVCIGDWESISTDMTGNEVLEYVETENNDGEIVVKVDGRKVKFDQPPIIQDGRTLVPVRAACEAMGINVQWIETEQRVILTKYGEEFDMQIGNKKYWMNQVSYYYFDVPPQIINGRTLLPIRAIAQFFGYDVEWNGNTQTVIIESE